MIFFSLWKLLNLSNRGLMALPDSIKNLRNVTHLYLNDNKLIVPPDELDTLPVSHGMMWGEKFLEIWGPVWKAPYLFHRDLWPPTRSGWTVLVISRILCDFGGTKLSTWHHFGACVNKLTIVELAYHYQLLLFVQPSNARQGLRPQTNQNMDMPSKSNPKIILGCCVNNCACIWSSALRHQLQHITLK